MTTTTDTQSRKRPLDDLHPSYEVLTDSETDNEEAFDLTNDVSNNSSTNQPAKPTGMNGADDETLLFFQEAGLSEEMLAQLGIDPEEIRAQRQLEQRSEQDRLDRELALRMQRELNANSQPTLNTPSSSTAPTAPPVPLPSRAPPLPAPQTNGLIGMNAQQFPPRSLPLSFQSQVQQQMHQRYMETFRRTLAEYQNGQPAVKRQRIDPPAAASSSSGWASSSAQASSSSAIEIDDTDDENCIDLTQEPDGWLAPPLPFGLNGSLTHIPHIPFQSLYSWRAPSYDVSSDDDDDQEDEGDYPLPPFTMDSGMFGARMRRIAKANAEEQEKQLRELLENIQYDEPPPPEDRTGTPERLAVALMEHQKVGLQWLTRMEESTNRGGILADDMGLGKTVQAMALMVSRPCEDATPIRNLPMMRKAKRRADQDPIKTKATLVVCPIALIAQWEREIRSKTDPPLDVIAHYGARRSTDETTLASFDVIITSYSTVANECCEEERDRGPLGRLRFHRVILDEAHTIKNTNTKAAQACCRLDAHYRWCMTATPIQNKIKELYSLIKFLHIPPYCEWDIFRDEIEVPLRGNDMSPVMRKVQALLKAISLRRSKKAKIDGRLILNLPERNVHLTHVDFSPDERSFYDFVNKQAQARFNKYMRAGTVMKNYSSVLVLLLRLRQACLHPKLTTMERSQDSNIDEDAQENLAHGMDMTVVNRLLHDDTDFSQIECPICMDMADQPQIIPGCGHMLCRECLDNYLNCSGHSEKRCPHCRGDLVRDKVISMEIFLKVHAPDLHQKFIEEKEEVDAEEAAAQERVEAMPSSTKIDKMLEILHETRMQTKNRDKTIVFSQFTAFLDIVEQPLKDHEFKYVRYDGSMTLRHREEVLHKFINDPKYTVLLVSTKCGSLGLNLTVANRVILMDVWWNPALENQAIDRVHRIGQQKAVEVHRIFINDTVEDRILALQTKKQNLADGALGEGRGLQLGRLGLQELLHLFRGTGV